MKFILLKLFLVFILIISCRANILKKEFKRNLIQKDTIYILFENGLGKMNKYRGFQYTTHDPKYYKIIYDLPVYWEQPSDPDESYFPFKGDYDHSFWFGTYKDTLVKVMDIPAMWGNSTILKKHKGFLTNHEILDYEWFKQRDPIEVTKALNLRKSYEKRPIFFIIDKDEFEKDSIILRNVIYHPEIIE